MKGMPSLSRYLTTYRRGDMVDIKADPSIQVGMPYQIYHGKTGVVFNVTKTAVGVEVTKTVGNPSSASGCTFALSTSASRAATSTSCSGCARTTRSSARRKEGRDGVGEARSAGAAPGQDC